MRIPKECPLCSNRILEIRKTYCGIKTYKNGRPTNNKPFNKKLAETTLYCPKCGKEENI